MVPNPIYEVFLIAITKIDHPDNSMTYSSANKKYLSVFTLPTIYSYYVNQSICLHGSCIILLKVNYLVQFQHYLPMSHSLFVCMVHVMHFLKVNYLVQIQHYLPMIKSSDKAEYLSIFTLPTII